jgi:rod shape determining protein RodA
MWRAILWIIILTITLKRKKSLMNLSDLSRDLIGKSQTNFRYKSHWQRFHIDPVLVLSLFMLIGFGLTVLFSAANQDYALVERQALRLFIAFGAMFVFAQIPTSTYKRWAPWAYSLGVALLIAVLIAGKIGKGAQRWLDLGIIRFQPSEMMKLCLPLMIAWFLSRRRLPPRFLTLVVAGILILIPTILTIKQPDLGTALMLVAAGCSVILFSGISWFYLIGGLLAGLVSLPVLWHFMHDYQRNRVLTFLNPERDPLGSGYHIIQSKIAIGSGGIWGKGWLQGTQSHLHFLPEHATDFIFAVCGEEFGLVGCLALITMYLLVVARVLRIAQQAQDSFTRLLASSIALTFFFSAFVNMGMVTGMLPVVGLPLPLVSYGGTSMITIMAGFGIVMSIHSHRKLWPN